MEAKVQKQKASGQTQAGVPRLREAADRAGDTWQGPPTWAPQAVG